MGPLPVELAVLTAWGSGMAELKSCEWGTLIFHGTAQYMLAQRVGGDNWGKQVNQQAGDLFVT